MMHIGKTEQMTTKRQKGDWTRESRVEICEANNEVGGHRRAGGRAKNESSSVGGTTGDHARQFLSIKSRIAIWCSFATGMM